MSKMIDEARRSWVAPTLDIHDEAIGAIANPSQITFIIVDELFHLVSLPV